MYQHHVLKMKFITLKYINKISRIEIGLQLFNKAFIEFFSSYFAKCGFMF